MAGLSIRSLRIFDAIMLTGTLGAAARSLNTSQSAASRQLLELEQDIGLTLFERSNRQLKPTIAGLRFHDEVQHILHGLNEIPAMAEAIKTEAQESLSVICMPRLSLGVLAPAEALFGSRNPEVRVRSSILRRNNIQRWAASRPFDIGVGMLPLHHRALKTKPLARLRAGILVHMSHALFEKNVVISRQLAETPLIGLAPGLMARAQIDALFNSSDITPVFETETTSALMAAELARLGRGAAIVDIAVASPFLGSAKTRFIPIEPASWWTMGTFQMNAKREPSKLSETFEASVIEVLKQLESGAEETLLELL